MSLAVFWCQYRLYCLVDVLLSIKSDYEADYIHVFIAIKLDFGFHILFSPIARVRQLTLEISLSSVFISLMSYLQLGYTISYNM